MYHFERDHRFSIKLYEEYAEKRTLFQYLDSLMENPEKNVRTDFLNVLFQIILALEVAQYRFDFCHYDLHMKNILVKYTINETITYPIMHETCTLHHVNHVIKIIDFGMSTLKTNKMMYGTKNYIKYGIYPFMISGKDVIKILLGFYYHIKKCTSVYDNRGKLLHFLEYCCLEFLHIDVKRESLAKIRKILQGELDLGVCSESFLNPYNFSCFLRNNSVTICNILEIDQLPWEWERTISTKQLSSFSFFRIQWKTFLLHCAFFFKKNFLSNFPMIQYKENVEHHVQTILFFSKRYEKCMEDGDGIFVGNLLEEMTFYYRMQQASRAILELEAKDFEAVGANLDIKRNARFFLF
jgi:hypothetical protein